jgi:glycosyl hydrolase family 134
VGKTEDKENTANVNTKYAIRKAGGTTLALAIAMLEDKHLRANYPFGDIYPDGKPKIGDAANFGIYKMNWYMIQQCPSAKRIIGNRPPSFVWQNMGTRINNDPQLATEILLQAMKLWSTDLPNPTIPKTGNFWAGHRWGESGLKNLTGTNWNDILRYYQSVQAIKSKCDNDDTVWESDVRYWVNLPPV